MSVPQWRPASQSDGSIPAFSPAGPKTTGWMAARPRAPAESTPARLNQAVQAKVHEIISSPVEKMMPPVKWSPAEKVAYHTGMLPPKELSLKSSTSLDEIKVLQVYFVSYLSLIDKKILDLKTGKITIPDSDKIEKILIEYETDAKVQLQILNQREKVSSLLEPLTFTPQSTQALEFTTTINQSLTKRSIGDCAKDIVHDSPKISIIQEVHGRRGPPTVVLAKSSTPLDKSAATAKGTKILAILQEESEWSYSVDGKTANNLHKRDFPNDDSLGEAYTKAHTDGEINASHARKILTFSQAIYSNLALSPLLKGLREKGLNSELGIKYDVVSIKRWEKSDMSVQMRYVIDTRLIDKKKAGEPDSATFQLALTVTYDKDMKATGAVSRVQNLTYL